MPPSEYLSEIFSDDTAVFDTEDEAQKILGLMMRHWNAIAGTLEKEELWIPVFVEEGEDGLPRGNHWAHGFVRGMTLRHEAWDPLVRSEKHGGYVLPMMVLDNEHNPDPELRPEPISPEKRKDILAYMGAGLMLVYRHFKAQRQPGPVTGFDDFDEFDDDAPTPWMRSEPKVGRNNPCPCGSGKKYKRCHGATVQ